MGITPPALRVLPARRATATVLSSGSNINFCSRRYLRINRHCPSSATCSSRANVQIDDLRVYDTAFSSADVLALESAGDVTPVTPVTLTLRLLRPFRTLRTLRLLLRPLRTLRTVRVELGRRVRRPARRKSAQGTFRALRPLRTSYTFTSVTQARAPRRCSRWTFLSRRTR